jgi:hypothetical protein
MAEELTPLQKVQAEYNQAVSALGHTMAQILKLQTDKERLETSIKKIVNRADNIANKKPVEATEEPKLEEVKDGTAS